MSGRPATSSGATYAGDDVTRRPCVLRVDQAGGDPEVGEVRVAVLVEQDVRRLDVAVDDALPVGIRERAGDLRQQPGGRLEVPRAALERPLQRASAQPAHHEVRALRISPVVVERNEVRMLELGDESRLRLEPAHERGLVDQLGADHLDRDLAPDRRLVRAIDDADVAAADLLAELVAPHRAAERADRDGRRHAVDPERREVRGEPVEQELEDVLRAADALEPELAERLRLPAASRRRQRGVRVGGEQHLPAVRSGEHPAGAVHHRTEVVPAARLDLPDVDRHADAQRLQPAPVGRGEQALDLAGGGDRRADVGEREVDAVADALHDPSSRRLDRAEHDPVVLGDRGAHGLRLHFPEDGRVLDIGEQEGDRLHLWLRLEQERRVLVEDPSLELLQLRRGLEAELLRQVRARLLIRAKRFHLTTRAVEREHVLLAVALVDGKLLAQHLELGDQLRMSSEHELRLDPQLDGAEPQLLEASRFELERERAGHVCIRVTTPERERRTELLGGLGGSGLHEPARLLDRPLELERIDVLRVGDESIAPVVADDDVADRGPEVRDVRLQRRARAGGRLVAPDAVDQRVDRHRLPHLRR